jgi:hypothetical protein
VILPRFGGVENHGIDTTEGGEYAKATENVHQGVLVTKKPLLVYFFRSDLQQDTHLTGLPVAILLVSKVALNELLEVKVGPFFGDFNHAATNTHGTLPMGRVNDTYHDPWIALDIAKLLMAFDGVDQNVSSIGIYPGLRHLRRAIWHDCREKADNAPLQELLEFG